MSIECSFPTNVNLLSRIGKLDLQRNSSTLTLLFLLFSLQLYQVVPIRTRISSVIHSFLIKLLTYLSIMIKNVCSSIIFKFVK